MQIEHFGYQVAEPVETARWYVEQLGFSIRRQLGPPTHTHFLADSSGQVMIEIYRNSKVSVPDYRAMDPLLLHLAILSEDPEADRDRLLAAGATIETDLTTTDAGDRLVMLRDPWGLALQLACRKNGL